MLAIANFANLYSKIYDHVFDRYYRVETRRRVEIEGLALSQSLRAQAHRYEPVPYVLLHTLFDKLIEMKLGHLPLIDYGSGKGRVLLVAKRYGFKHVVGVEADARLVAISQYNLQAQTFSRQVTMARSQYQILNQDATEKIKWFDADADSNSNQQMSALHFFFNPFAWPTLEKVLQNILSEEKEQFLILVNPAYIQQVISMGFQEVLTLQIRSCPYRVKILFKPAAK